MKKDNFELKIYTPAGLLVVDIASEVYLTAVDGELGILPKHCDYTTLLGTGVLRYVEAETYSERRLNISGGFCNFSRDTLTLLADSAEDLTPQ